VADEAATRAAAYKTVEIFSGITKTRLFLKHGRRASNGPGVMFYAMLPTVAGRDITPLSQKFDVSVGFRAAQNQVKAFHLTE